MALPGSGSRDQCGSLWALVNIYVPPCPDGMAQGCGVVALGRTREKNDRATSSSLSSENVGKR